MSPNYWFIYVERQVTGAFVDYLVEFSLKAHPLAVDKDHKYITWITDEVEQLIWERYLDDFDSLESDLKERGMKVASLKRGDHSRTEYFISKLK